MKTSSSPTVIARGDAVYFIATECRSYVKIGRSNDTMKRLKSLQTSSPLKLVLLGAVHAKPAYEKYLHACFAKHRIHGEWFALHTVVEKAVATILGQPTLNFPSFEYAAEINGVSFSDFVHELYSPFKKEPQKLDPLDEYYKSEDWKRSEAERDAMSSEQLKLLSLLQEAQVHIMKQVDARGNDQIMKACKTACWALQELGRDSSLSAQVVAAHGIAFYNKSVPV